MSGAAGKILFCVNSSWNVVNFRLGLLRGLRDEGFDIVVAAPRDASSEAIERAGFRFIELPMAPRGRNPLGDLRLTARFLRLMRAERPNLYLAYTAKPNIYGSLAARLCGVATINNIAGLGSVFNERGPVTHLVRRLYRFSLRRSSRVFFQNREDMRTFVELRLVSSGIADTLPGSGIDLVRFAPRPRSADGARGCVFLMAARLLRDKGVAELAAAAALVRAGHPDVEVRVLGFLRDGDGAFVQRRELARWQADGLLSYQGETDDVRPHIAAADCVVLPSFYPEGTPRVLLEAAAMGRPIITTDMPGCRAAVDAGESGFLVPPRDATALAAAMARFVELTDSERAALGRSARRKAEREFDERIVIDRYVDALRFLRGARENVPIFT